MENFYEEDQLEYLSIEEKEYEQLVRGYLGNNEYHTKNWELYKGGKTKYNFIPFFVGPFWLLAKGMILYAFVYFIIVFTFVSVISESYIRLGVKGFELALAIYGNKMYYFYIDKKVKKVLLMQSDIETKLETLKKIKKRNIIIGICLSILYVIVILYGIL